LHESLGRVRGTVRPFAKQATVVRVALWSALTHLFASRSPAQRPAEPGPPSHLVAMVRSRAVPQLVRRERKIPRAPCKPTSARRVTVHRGDKTIVQLTSEPCTANRQHQMARLAPKRARQLRGKACEPHVKDGNRRPEYAHGAQHADGRRSRLQRLHGPGSSPRSERRCRARSAHPNSGPWSCRGHGPRAASRGRCTIGSPIADHARAFGATESGVFQPSESFGLTRFLSRAIFSG
jgi:hypothetical protein